MQKISVATEKKDRESIQHRRCGKSRSRCDDDGPPTDRHRRRFPSPEPSVEPITIAVSHALGRCPVQGQLINALGKGLRNARDPQPCECRNATVRRGHFDSLYNALIVTILRADAMSISFEITSFELFVRWCSTKPATVAGVAALIQYVLDDDLVVEEDLAHADA
jgi:hypothetical protein